MRLLAITALLSISASMGFGQKKPATPAKPEHITLMAEHEIKDGGTVKLRGHVQVITTSATIYADEADYNPLTGEVDARGHVRIDLKKGNPSITILNSTPEDVPVSSSK